MNIRSRDFTSTDNLLLFVIRISEFFRHSCFFIRHWRVLSSFHARSPRSAPSPLPPRLPLPPPPHRHHRIFHAPPPHQQIPPHRTLGLHHFPRTLPANRRRLLLLPHHSRP